MRANRGNRGITPLFFNLGTRWKWMGNFTPRLSYPQEITPALFDYKAGFTEEPFRTVLEKMEFSCNAVAGLTEIFRLPTQHPTPQKKNFKSRFSDILSYTMSVTLKYPSVTSDSFSRIVSIFS